MAGRYDGATPLMLAAKAGSCEAVQLLLDLGALVDVRSKKSGTALCGALQSWGQGCRGHHEGLQSWGQAPEVLHMLLEARADPNKPPGERSSHLMAAMERGHLEAVRLLLQAGATVDTSSVVWAADLERLDVLSLLLEARGDANAIHANGSEEPCSVVFAAVSKGGRGALRLLLEGRGDANMLQPDGRVTPVLQAAMMSDASAMRLLLEARGNVNEPMVAREHPVAMQPGPLQLSMINSTGRVTSVAPGGQAAENGVQRGWRLVSLDGEPYQESLVHSKIASGEPYNIVFSEEEGVTPALIAAKAGASRVLAALQEAGADIASSSPGCQSPVTAAAEGSHVDALCLLLNARGDPALARAKSAAFGAKAASP